MRAATVVQIMFRGYALRTQAGNEYRHEELGLLKGRIIKDVGNCHEVWQIAVDGLPGDSLRRMVNCASLVISAPDLPGFGGLRNLGHIHQTITRSHHPVKIWCNLAVKYAVAQISHKCNIP
jgi:hypothetical protein